MSNQETNSTNNTIDFNHRINSDFYESMLDIMNRVAGIADVMGVASQLDDGGLSSDSIPAVAQAIRMEMGDAKSILDAWFRGDFK
ncbi:hypothetical protein ACH50O_15310 [Methylomonas sp. 2BW1-5-20]|uniref:hypothetical protein n=1 Tax=Methylomonas sp. 2BW1-5-20 TaxID=3376686 RepID=UPI004050A5DF